MAQQELNRADIGSRFQKMNSERVAHGMGAYTWIRRISVA
jgi:hypothetical protein